MTPLHAENYMDQEDIGNYKEQKMLNLAILFVNQGFSK
jgi:hypothetical protein